LYFQDIHLFISFSIETFSNMISIYHQFILLLGLPIALDFNTSTQKV